MLTQTVRPSLDSWDDYMSLFLQVRKRGKKDYYIRFTACVFSTDTSPLQAKGLKAIAVFDIKNAFD